MQRFYAEQSNCISVVVRVFMMILCCVGRRWKVEARKA